MIKAPLSVRIVLLVLVTSGILVGGMLATVYQLMVSDYEALVAERETAVIKRVASELELSNQKRLLGLEAFATRLVNDDGQLLDGDTLQSLLQRSSVASELFPDGLLVLDAEATAIAEDQYSPGRLGSNYADRPHFQRARQTQQAVISEPILGRTTGLPLLSYLQPIVAQSGDLIGYAGGLLNLANTPLVGIDSSTVESDSTTATLIIDPRHRLFVSMQERFDSPEPLPDEGVDALVDAALSLSPAGTIVEYQRESYLVASQQLDSPGWIILRALPYSEAIAPAQASFRHFLIITLLAMIIVGLAGAWIARSLTQPIERITRRIEHMADNARFDSDFQEKGGPEVTALAHAMNRLANERKAAYVAIHQAERFLSSVLESASELSIVATDTAGIITAFNKGAENMLGYSSLEMIGKQTPAILHLKEEVDVRSTQLSTELGHSVEGFRVFVEKAEQNGSEKREWTYIHKDGHQIPVSMVVTIMRDSAGEINGYLGIAENITERKRADKIKTEFISTVNHELRTPLTSISGALGLLVGGNVGELPAKAQALLATAHRNSKRLTHLINDLLDIEKIAQGKLHFDMQAHAVMPLLEQALEANQHYGSNRDITLSLTGNASNALINVDSQRFMQIMANLLSNAIKFSPQGGEVSLAVETAPQKIRISVTDSGPGIANAFREQIFQRFAQADASDTRAKEGTGLGLAITRELVEHMGGRIDFESTEGEGSRFFFELPLVQAAEETFRQPEDETGHHASPRILVVEDDQDVAKLLGTMLTDAGYQVDTAFTGADALNRLQQRHYDLISLDLMLPDCTGLDLIHLLRQQPGTADIPIVVVSAKMEQGRLDIFGDTTNIDWLAKPIDQQQLMEIVQQQLSTTLEPHPRILHIEDDTDLHEVVCAMAGDHFTFEAARTLQEARTRLKQGAFDVVLLDIGLPDGSGWDLVPDIRACQPDAKLVILSGVDMTQQQHGQVEAVLLKSRLSRETLINGINARIESIHSNGQAPANSAR